MERTAIVSSNIVSIGYDSSASTLEIEFQNGVYQYYNVPPEIFEGLIQSPSKGSFFDQYIRKAGYAGAKI
jgi:uncharacterized protein